MEFYILAGITLLALVISLIKDRKKTLKALKTGGKRLLKILIPVILMVLATSVVLAFFPESQISRWLGIDNFPLSPVIAAIVGSITLMPGFIAFPLGGVLKESGVPMFVISAFTSTLMMVGIATISVEQKYLGLKVSLWRNLAGLIIALIVALVTGVLYGELFL